MEQLYILHNSTLIAPWRRARHARALLSLSANWIGLLRKSLRLRSFRTLRECYQKRRTWKLSNIYFTWWVATWTTVKNLDNQLKDICALTLGQWQPAILTERQWPDDYGTVKLFMPLRAVIEESLQNAQSTEHQVLVFHKSCQGFRQTSDKRHKTAQHLCRTRHQTPPPLRQF